jgi:hypothetical protein
MNQADLMAKLGEYCDLNLEVARSKNTDYATGSDAFANFRSVERHGLSVGQGFLVRMEDKMSRLGNLLHKPAAVKTETLKDTALDLANYAMLLAAWWEWEDSGAD